ncbi:MAG: tetratricopeptide repeat protein, partial [Calothrix sp. SM1_5_4]|nr:tetratricopeptide repeat protein [Calothrix sp. SM1_5_4]
RTKKGREALYQAAYLSYQFQDYDGAVRKFQEFAKANPRSGLSKDAQWHLAWLQYLRNDFKGALERFEAVAKQLKSRRKSGDSLQEKLLYWIAMSRVRLNRLEEARSALETVVARNPYSYYGLAAQARLEGIVSKLAETKNRLPAQATVAVEGSASSPDKAAAEEKESEEDLVEDESAEAALQKEGPDEEERIQASEFRDPALRARIDVAQRLTELGLHELARWELWEVEKKTRNSQYLRMLISAYEGISSYHRSASLAELSFGREREQHGFDGAAGLLGFQLIRRPIGRSCSSTRSSLAFPRSGSGRSCGPRVCIRAT